MHDDDDLVVSVELLRFHLLVGRALRLVRFITVLHAHATSVASESPQERGLLALCPGRGCRQRRSCSNPSSASKRSRASWAAPAHTAAKGSAEPSLPASTSSATSTMFCALASSFAICSRRCCSASLSALSRSARICFSSASVSVFDAGSLRDSVREGRSKVVGVDGGGTRFGRSDGRFTNVARPGGGSACASSAIAMALLDAAGSAKAREMATTCHVARAAKCRWKGGKVERSHVAE